MGRYDAEFVSLRSAVEACVGLTGASSANKPRKRGEDDSINDLHKTVMNNADLFASNFVRIEKKFFTFMENSNYESNALLERISQISIDTIKTFDKMNRRQTWLVFGLGIMFGFLLVHWKSDILPLVGDIWSSLTTGESPTGEVPSFDPDIENQGAAEGTSSGNNFTQGLDKNETTSPNVTVPKTVPKPPLF